MRKAYQVCFICLRCCGLERGFNPLRLLLEIFSRRIDLPLLPVQTMESNQKLSGWHCYQKHSCLLKNLLPGILCCCPSITLLGLCVSCSRKLTEITQNFWIFVVIVGIFWLSCHRDAWNKLDTKYCVFKKLNFVKGKVFAHEDHHVPLIFQQNVLSFQLGSKFFMQM